MSKIFGRGLIILLPLGITILIIDFVIGTIDPVFQPIIELIFDRDIPGLGLLAFIVIVFLVGLTTFRVAAAVGHFFERYIMKSPFIGGLYTTARQVSLSVRGSRDSGFNTVVSVPFPTAPSIAIGFLTREFMNTSGDRHGIVYIPTTPVPSSGFLVIVPMRDVKVLNISSSEAMQLVITGGIVCPDGLTEIGA